MAYYIILDDNVYRAENEETLREQFPDLEIQVLPNDYEKGKYTVVDGELVLNPNWEHEKEQERRQMLDEMSLTKREVFLALYKDKGITPEQVKAQITDTEALIEFEYANDYFRGNPLINLIGQALGYSSDDLDYLFEYKELPSSN